MTSSLKKEENNSEFHALRIRQRLLDNVMIFWKIKMSYNQTALMWLMRHTKFQNCGAAVDEIPTAM